MYSLVGWVATENFFQIPKEWFFTLFGAVCLIVNLYLFAKICEDENDWGRVFFFSLIGFSLIFSSMTLNGIFQEYAFIALSALAIIFTIIQFEELSIESVLQFLSIIITYFFLVSSYYTFGKVYLDKWLYIINSLVNFRLVLSITISVLVLGEGAIRAFQSSKPNIPLIPYIKYIPTQILNPFIGIVEGFKKSGVWLRNNVVYFLNLVWVIFAHIGHYIYQTFLNTKNRILSFIEHSDKIIASTLLIYCALLFVDYSIRLSRVEITYLWSSTLDNLLHLLFLFTLVIVLAIIIKFAIDFEYRKLNVSYLSNLVKGTFSGMVQAPLTIASYYCGAGWLLWISSSLAIRFGNWDLLPHFHSLGIYTIISSLVLLIVIVVVSFISPKSDEKGE